MHKSRKLAAHKNYSTLVLLVTVVAAVVYSSAHAKSQAQQSQQDELVISSDNDIYRYVDENGDIVFQDRPRAEHYVKDPVSPEVEAPVTATPEKKSVTPTKDNSTWPPYALLAGALGGLAGAVYLLVHPLFTRWRDETPMDRCLRIADMPMFKNIQLSDGQRRNIEVDRIVKTPAGLLVLAERRFSGQISGTAAQTAWQTQSDEGEPSVMNPIKLVDTASDITRSLIDDIPVFGRVVYTGHAVFTNGRPASVLKFADFKNGLDHYATPAVESKQLDAAWRRLMRFPRSNATRIKPPGAGWRGWLRKHWRHTASGGLAVSSLALFVMAMVLF